MNSGVRHFFLYHFQMKKMLSTTLLSLLLIVASVAYGAVPPMNVTVSDTGGKVAFEGSTNANGTFATGNLKSGNYVVQFNSKSAAVKGSQYGLVISAGTKKVSASAVSGEKFAAGGVAMKVDVGAGLNITGQVTSAAAGPMKNGKAMVWINKQLGSNIPGHWVDADSAEAKQARTAGSISTQDLQNRQTQGVSMPGR
jgi:hypothetical protein